jgi:hypothetical protein
MVWAELISSKRLLGAADKGWIDFTPKVVGIGYEPSGGTPPAPKTEAGSRPLRIEWMRTSRAACAHGMSGSRSPVTIP